MSKKDDLKKLATETFGQIEPCGNRQSLEDCFTEEGGMLCFWFNDKENSTHLLTEDNL
jgi:hypothetical protein